MIKDVIKLWGRERWIVNGSLYCMKFLYIYPGFSSSLHYHKIKDETFYIDDGECFAECGPYGGLEEVHIAAPVRLFPGSVLKLPPFTVHRFWIPLGSVRFCKIIEVSTTHDDDDVYRLQESRRL